MFLVNVRASGRLCLRFYDMKFYTATLDRVSESCAVLSLKYNQCRSDIYICVCVCVCVSGYKKTYSCITSKYIYAYVGEIKVSVSILFCHGVFFLPSSFYLDVEESFVAHVSK